MATAFVELPVGIVAQSLRRAARPPIRLPAALNGRCKERKTKMTAETFRTLSSWVAAAFLSTMMLTAAVTSHPILI